MGQQSLIIRTFFRRFVFSAWLFCSVPSFSQQLYSGTTNFAGSAWAVNNTNAGNNPNPAAFQGTSSSGYAFWGTTNTGPASVYGFSSAGYSAVWGYANAGFGVIGASASADAGVAGVYGTSPVRGGFFDSNGVGAEVNGRIGLLAVARAGCTNCSYAGPFAIKAVSSIGVGIHSETSGSNLNDAIEGITTANARGVTGTSYGVGSFSSGVLGWSSHENGVAGFSNATTASGVYGENLTLTAPGGFGVAGRSGPPGVAILGDNTSSTQGYAGYFTGRVAVIGLLSKGGGSFKIDHPLDPENKFLYHSFVESPEMKNVYDGVTTADAEGSATVQLPDWFEALNDSFRYQLTPIGGPASLFVAAEMNRGRFVIGGARPGMRVSWQVTGVRKDAFAKANRIPTEEWKAEAERGRYLHPAAFGLGEDRAIRPEPAVPDVGEFKR